MNDSSWIAVWLSFVSFWLTFQTFSVFFFKCRIERLWRDVWTGVTHIYYDVLHSLEEDGFLNISDSLHLFCAHYTFLPRPKIWPSFLLAGMIIPSGQSIAFHQTSCGNLGCCSTPSESHRDMKKIWQLSINGNVLVLLSAICRFLKSFTYALLYFRKSKLRALIGRVQGYPIITTQVFWCQKWNVHWMLKILNLYAFP